MIMQIDTKRKAVSIDTNLVTVEDLILLRDLHSRAMEDLANETFAVEKKMCYE